MNLDAVRVSAGSLQAGRWGVGEECWGVGEEC